MTRLKTYTFIFLFLLLLPIGYLVYRVDRSLDHEEFYRLRQEAERIISRTDANLQDIIEQEQKRSYAEYRFFFLPESPLPEQSRSSMSISPLAEYPVNKEIPGLVGYFQIEPDAKIHTPLLPHEDKSQYATLAHLGERLLVFGTLRKIIRSTSLLSSDRVRREATSLLKSKEQPQTLQAHSGGKKWFDSKLEEKFAQILSSRLKKTKEKNASGKSFPSRHRAQAIQQETTKAQVEAFDPKAATSVGGAAKQEARASDEDHEASSATLADKNSFPQSFATPAPQTEEEEQDFHYVTEVQPLQSMLVDDQWLILSRKVWWQSRRYVQGFASNVQHFFSKPLTDNIEGTILEPLVTVVLLHDESPLTAHRDDSKQLPQLLYQANFSYPLHQFGVAFLLADLPKSTGHDLIYILALLIGGVLIGGVSMIYRLTKRQVELSKKQSDFVAAVSHELKTPLTSIRMYGEMLKEGWVADEAAKKEYYSFIQTEGERLTRLIENVLRLSQIDQKDWQSNIIEIDLVDFVSSFEQRNRQRIEEAGFAFQCSLPDQPVIIKADTDLLTQILINLIDNAIKFSAGSEKQIDLAVEVVGNTARLHIRDYGPGIPEQIRTQLFDRFVRGDDEMTRSTQGTGIGLALVKTLVEKMSARISFENREPGVDFIISFNKQDSVS